MANSRISINWTNEFCRRFGGKLSSASPKLATLTSGAYIVHGKICMSACTYRESNSRRKDNGTKECTSVSPGRLEIKTTSKHFVKSSAGCSRATGSRGGCQATKALRGQPTTTSKRNLTLTLSLEHLGRGVEKQVPTVRRTYSRP